MATRALIGSRATVAPSRNSVGATVPFSAQEVGARRFCYSSGKYTEAGMQNRLWIASLVSIGPTSSISTVNPNFQVWNSLTSKVSLVILELRISVNSGTMGSGGIFHAVTRSGLRRPTDGTIIQPRPANLSRALPTSGWMVCAAGTIVSGNTDVLRPALSTGVNAVTDTFISGQLVDYGAGQIVIPPGAYYCAVTSHTNAVSPNISCSALIEEIPLNGY